MSPLPSLPVPELPSTPAAGDFIGGLVGKSEAIRGVVAFVRRISDVDPYDEDFGRLRYRFLPKP